VLSEVDEIIKKREAEGLACIPIFGHIFTGFGKTYTFINFAVSKGLPILVIVNSDSIR
jgi:hypothetical protein